MFASSAAKSLLPPKYRRTYGALTRLFECGIKGCEACRNRPVRCDKALPACSRCAKRGIECPGYDKQFTWVVGPSVRSWKRKQVMAKTATGKQSRGHRGNDKCSGDDGSDHSDQLENENPSSSSSSPSSPSSSSDDEGHPTAQEVTDLQLLPSLSTLNTEHVESCRQHHFLAHYFDRAVNRMSIMEGPSNPFGEGLREYMARSEALYFTVVAIGAMHVANSGCSPDVLLNRGEASAWHYRTMALNMLQKDLCRGSHSVEVLLAVLFLGMTESWFDERNSGSVHIGAAKRLLLHKVNSGVEIPSFLIHCLSWVDMLASFVSDNEDPMVSSPLVPPTSPGETRDDDAFDPLVGTWGTLIPLVGRAGTLARKIRREGSKTDDQLNSLVEAAETDLLQWQNPHAPLIHSRNHQPQSSQSTSTSTNTSTKEFYCTAEAYRLSALLTLYNYSPTLLRKRLSLISDEVATASDFLSHLARSTVELLRQIPLDSRLWNVCAVPILSAGQLVMDAGERDFLRSVQRMLGRRIRVSAVGRVVRLLEDVWARRDAGDDVWWVDLLDESGSPILVN